MFAVCILNSAPMCHRVGKIFPSQTWFTYVILNSSDSTQLFPNFLYTTYDKTLAIHLIPLDNYKHKEPPRLATAGFLLSLTLFTLRVTIHAQDNPDKPYKKYNYNNRYNAGCHNHNCKCLDKIIENILYLGNGA